MRLAGDDHMEDDSPMPQMPESSWTKCSAETPKLSTLESMNPETLQEASLQEPVSKPTDYITK